MKRRATATTVGLTLLLILATLSPVTAANEPAGPIPDRIRLSGAGHDPGSIEISPDGRWATYYDFAGGAMYSVDISTGKRRSLGDLPPAEVRFTPDGAGVAMRPDPAFGGLLRRRGLVSGQLEINDRAVSLLSPLFSTTHDGMSLVYIGVDDALEWWDNDGSVTSLPTATLPRGVGGAPDRDLVLYATFDSATDETTIHGVTSGGATTTYGTIAGINGYFLDDAVFTFLPNQDRVIISLDLRDGRLYALGSWILNLATAEIEHAAPAFVPQVSPDGSTAFFEVLTDEAQYGRIVPTVSPDQAVDLADQHANGFFIHPEWTHIAELGSPLTLYEIDGTPIRDVATTGIIFTAEFVNDYIVTSQEASSTPVYSDPIEGGSRKRLSLRDTTAWIIGSYDGFAYWREFKNGSWTIWRSEPNGKWRARITRLYDSFDYADVLAGTGMLVFEMGGTLWAIDLTVLPKYSCVDLLATHIGTAKKDVIDGTDGNDVIVGLGGNDIIRGGDGRDRICSGNGDDRVVGEGDRDWLRGGNGDDQLDGKSGDDNINDRLGTNDIDGGPGTDLCKATGVIANCEKP